jgi:hypothetical protein
MRRSIRSSRSPTGQRDKAGGRIVPSLGFEMEKDKKNKEIIEKSKENPN